MRKFNSIEIHIDAENVTAKKIGSVIQRVSKYGDIRVKHCYADFSNNAVRPWLAACNEYSITPCQANTIITGKNTSDLELVKNCVMSLAKEKSDLMVLVSSDSDFTSTVRELREAGIYTIGVGERKTPRALQNAYNEFWFLDEFVAVEKKIVKVKRPDASAKKHVVVVRKPTVEELVIREIKTFQNKENKKWILASKLGKLLKKKGIILDMGLNDYIRNNKRFILSKDVTTNAWIVTLKQNY